MIIKDEMIVDVFFNNVTSEIGLKVKFFPDEQSQDYWCERKDGTIIIIRDFCKMVSHK